MPGMRRVYICPPETPSPPAAGFAGWPVAFGSLEAEEATGGYSVGVVGRVRGRA
jgi:hypothetical protein